ncbi:type II secretion system F family protein [bacterium]|nr:type II secretion system F family protein [bacterium]
MKNFFYSAQDKKGTIQTGVIEAQDALSAKKHLEQQSLLVLWIKEKQEGSFTFFKKVSVGAKAVFMRQLATMLKAGFPIDKALAIIETETQNKYFQEIVGNVGEQVRAGNSLSKAMESYSDVFEPVIIAVVRSGEASGNLPEVFETLAKILEDEAHFSSSLWSALLYPIFVVAAMLVVGFLVITDFVPRIKVLFEEANVDLPWQTKLVVGVGMFLAHYWWALLLGLIVIGIFFYWCINSSKKVKMWTERLLFSLPVVKDVLLRSQMARLNRLFYLLFKSATPILEAIDLVKNSMSFLIIKESLDRIKAKVERGLPFSSSLAQESVFPTLESQLISVGEQTGSLEKMFLRLAQYYQEKTDSYVKKVVSLVEPIIIVVLAVGVAIMVWSVFGPIYGLVQLPIS